MILGITYLFYYDVESDTMQLVVFLNSRLYVILTRIMIVSILNYYACNKFQQNMIVLIINYNDYLTTIRFNSMNIYYQAPIYLFHQGTIG